MIRAQLEHLIRAAGEIAQDREVIVLGSQAVLAQFPQAPAELLVSEETATLPAGWKTRLVMIRNENTSGVTGWCLEVHDLAISKLVAGREKDLEYVRCLIRHHMLQPATLRDRLRATNLSPAQTPIVTSRLERLLAE